MPAAPCILAPEHRSLQPVAVPPPFDGMLAWPVANRVGESPVWDATSRCLCWIDVRAPAVMRLDPASGAFTRWHLPEVVGAMALTRSGRAILALRHGLAWFDPASGALSPLDDIADEPAGNRLNEGKLSPGGGWFVFGSMDDRPGPRQATGSLYRADPAGRVTRLHAGLTTANGVAWSPDARWLYFSDSFAGRIFRAAWDEASGAMGEPALFARSDEAAGRPDGALVDSDGTYLSAGVSAGCLNRLSPQGAWLGHMPLPVRAPTMPCFGGPRGRTLFVTSLVRPGPTEPGPWDGWLLQRELAGP